ncbi:MAG: DUF1573 domain-containing protein [Planctomycetota bacterium]|nr:DUF1573 domain-containing protein [Planctomycetota bacterium]
MNSLTTRRLILALGLSAIFGGAFYLLSLFRGGPILRDANEELYSVPNADMAPSAKGPWPRVGIDSELIEFGNGLEGDELVRSVTLRNDGEAPLRVRSGSVACDCELEGLPTEPIAPGDSVELKYIWRPILVANELRQPYEIVTNDPQKPRIRLKIQGEAIELYRILPDKEWKLQLLSEVGRNVFIGRVASQAKPDFRVTSVDVGGAPIDVTVRPPNPEDAAATARKDPVWEIQVSVRPEMPVGTFDFPIILHTDIPDVTQRDRVGGTTGVDVTVNVTGRRKGPFRIIGKGWYEERDLLSLGTFPAATGRSQKYLFFCEDAAHRDIQIQKIESDADPLKFELRKDEDFKGRGAKFELVVTFPPGENPTSRRESNAATVRILTDHPTCPEIAFICEYTAS